MKEQELRRSERRYRRLVETAGEGIWAFDPDGSTSYANPRMGEMLGLPPEELVGRPAERVPRRGRRPARDLGGDRQRCDRAASFELRGRDGTVRSVVVTARPIGQDEVPARGHHAPERTPPAGFC